MYISRASASVHSLFDFSERNSSSGKGRDGDDEKSGQTGNTSGGGSSAENEDHNQASASVSSLSVQEKAGSNTSLPSSTTDTTTRVAATSAEMDAKRAELERELAAMTLTPDFRNVLRRHVSDSGRQETVSTGGADLLVTAPRPQANSCPSELEADLAKEGATGKGGHRLLTADYEQTQSLNPGGKRPSLSTLRHSLRRRANTLGGTLVQGAQAVGSGVNTLGGTLVQGKTSPVLLNDRLLIHVSSRF